MKVSIIVPVYNAEKYLRECIDSLLRQSYSNIDIVLVNDGSVDSSAALCNSYAEQYANIRVIHQSNSGAAAARRTGVLNAAGDYIMFVDADDWLEPDYISRFFEPVQHFAPDIVAATFKRVTKTGEETYRHFFEQGFYDEKLLWEAIFPQMLSASPYYTFGIAPSMCGKLFKKEIVLKSLYALEGGITFGEDACFTYCAILNSKSVFILNANGYIYRDNEESATHNFRMNLLDDPRKIYRFYYTLSQTHAWDCKKQLDDYMVGVCHHVAFGAVKSADFPKIEKRLTACVRENFPRNFFKGEAFKTCTFQYRIICRLICGCHWKILRFLLNRRRGK